MRMFWGERLEEQEQQKMKGGEFVSLISSECGKRKEEGRGSQPHKAHCDTPHHQRTQLLNAHASRLTGGPCCFD